MKAAGNQPRPFIPLKPDSPHLKRFLEEAKRAAEYQAIKGYSERNKQVNK